MKKIKPITPEKLPLRAIDCEEFSELLGKANFVLGCFEEVTAGVKNPEKIFRLLMKEEAQASLHAQRVPVGLFEQAKTTKKKSAQEQIHHYEAALMEAMRYVKTHPLSLTLVRKLHAKIKKSGKASRFRLKQNWIGPVGCKIDQAYFFPPKPQLVTAYMQNLVRYTRLHEKARLVQLAIFFAQFLIIHPFMDGNGRVARALVPLFLYKKKVLSQPLFFLSEFFNVHRLRYFQKLYAISVERDWEDWIRFFLEGVIQQGTLSCEKARRVVHYYGETKSVLPRTVGHKIACFLCSHPIFSEEEFPYPRFLPLLKKTKLIARKKEKRWIAPPLLQITKLKLT